MTNKILLQITSIKMNPEHLIELVTVFVIRLGIAILIFMLGFWFTKRIHKLIVKILRKSNLDATVISFLSNLSYLEFLPQR